jgi:very-short-patch-repair endonuclease
MRHQQVSSVIRSRAQEMRSHPTDVERALWCRLRGRKLGGLKFRRQQPIGRYIADLACFEALLLIELDGRQHEGSDSDIWRSRTLVERGFRIIRFENDRLRVDIDGVCASILEAAMSRLSTPHPPIGEAIRHLLPQGEKVRASIVSDNSPTYPRIRASARAEGRCSPDRNVAGAR